MRSPVERSRRFTSSLTCFAAIAAIALAASSAPAGMITGLTWHSGVASVAGEFIVAPSAPNNDDVAGISPNVVFVLQKNYVGIGPVDLVFEIADTGGTTEYRVEEGVSNSTGLDWSGYHMELGFGVGAGFVKATSGVGLDFDAPDYNSPVSLGTFFSALPATEFDLIGTGFMPAAAFNAGILLHIDVPDGITSFTLRQSPIAVPEPAAGLLISMFGVAAICAGRRRAARPTAAPSRQGRS